MSPNLHPSGSALTTNPSPRALSPSPDFHPTGTLESPPLNYNLISTPLSNIHPLGSLQSDPSQQQRNVHSLGTPRTNPSSPIFRPLHQPPQPEEIVHPSGIPRIDSLSPLSPDFHPAGTSESQIATQNSISNSSNNSRILLSQPSVNNKQPGGFYPDLSSDSINGITNISTNIHPL